MLYIISLLAFIRATLCNSMPVSLLLWILFVNYCKFVITCSLSDDKDLQREMRNMYIRTNTLRCRFGKCSKKVNARVFRSYCLCMYGTALWNTYTVNCMKKLRSCYHRCIKSFFGMIDCIVLQLFFWICSFPALTLFCIIINSRLICSSHVVVMT